MPSTITCPKCGHAFEATDAMQAQLRHELEAQFRSQYQQRIDDVDRQQQQLRQHQQQLKDAKDQLAAEKLQVDQKVKEELARQTRELERKARDAARKEVEEQHRQQQAEDAARLVQLRKELDETRGREKQLLQQKEQLDEERKNWELQKLREREELKRKLEAQAQQDAAEKHALTLKEKESVIEDLKKRLEEASRRATQGSQQAQGEAFEVELEELLRKLFPEDRIEPVGKGVQGGDVLQRVVTTGGLDCGTILWESKRTKAFNADWLVKLRQDQRNAKAQVAVLTSTTMPGDCATFTLLDDVWVTSRACIGPVAAALRQGLIRTAAVLRAHEGHKDKTALLYDYLTGDEFRHRIEGIVEAYRTMRDELEEEKRAMTRLWAKRDKQLGLVLHGLAGVFGDFQGIAGAALPTIQALALPQDPPALPAP